MSSRPAGDIAAVGSPAPSIIESQRPGFRVKIPDQFRQQQNGVSLQAVVTANNDVSSTVGGGGSDAAKPPCPPPGRSRQTRAEQLLQELDADIERDRRRTRRSCSADRAGGSGGDGLRSKEQQRQLPGQRLQTPPPMHLGNYSAGPGSDAILLDDNAVVTAAAPAAPCDPVLSVERRHELQPPDVAPGAQPSTPSPRLSPDECQRLLDRVLLEKETMATELHHLRQELQAARPRHPTLPEYDPDSPVALKRRISDMEQHISDLQEANETLKAAAGSRGQHQLAAETRMRAMLDELTVENQALKNEVSRLHQRDHPDMSFIRAELESLRSELDLLRDRNYQLERENRRLVETGGGALRGGAYYSDGYGISDSYSAENPHRSMGDRSLWGSETAGYERPEYGVQSIGGRGDLIDDGAYPDQSTEYRRRPHYGSLGRPDERLPGGWRGRPPCQQPPRIPPKTAAGAFGDVGGDSESPETEGDSGGDGGRGADEPATNWGRRSVERGPTPSAARRGSHQDGLATVPVGTASAFSTAGRQPFAPRQAGDIRKGDLVKFTRYGGRISKGLVHFVGRLPGRSDFYVGIELDLEEGKHDGVYDGKRYFQCKPRKGVFVAFNKLIMCYQQQS